MHSIYQMNRLHFTKEIPESCGYLAILRWLEGFSIFQVHYLITDATEGSLTEWMTDATPVVIRSYSPRAVWTITILYQIFIPNPRKNHGQIRWNAKTGNFKHIYGHVLTSPSHYTTSKKMDNVYEYYFVENIWYYLGNHPSRTWILSILYGKIWDLRVGFVISPNGELKEEISNHQ